MPRSHPRNGAAWRIGCGSATVLPREPRGPRSAPPPSLRRRARVRPTADARAQSRLERASRPLAREPFAALLRPWPSACRGKPLSPPTDRVASRAGWPVRAGTLPSALPPPPRPMGRGPACSLPIASLGPLRAEPAQGDGGLARPR